MTVYDLDGDGTNELLLTLRSGSGWERRILSNGAVIDTMLGLGPVNLQVGSIVHATQDELFYLADSSLYIFVHDVSTGIFDGLDDGAADDVGAAHLSVSAYPNPFNAAVTLSWSAAAEARSLTIYNVLGQSLRTYALSADTHELTWDGRDAQGRGVASGVYFSRLETRGAVRTVKLVLLR
jgi:hypothetical protein